MVDNFFQIFQLLPLNNTTVDFVYLYLIIGNKDKLNISDTHNIQYMIYIA